jgi:zinc transport system substrate-binding protein
MEGEAHDEEEEAEHEEKGTSYDPHVWLSPMNAKIEMENIKNALADADPENENYYTKNYEKYAAEFDKLDTSYKEGLADTKSKDVIAAHEAFGYLCKAYGLNQVGIEGLSPDSEPDPARMDEIIQFAKEHKVKTIFFEELVSPKVAETIADEIGAKTEVLNPLEGLSDEEMESGEDYFSVMETNLKVLKKALNQ